MGDGDLDIYGNFYNSRVIAFAIVILFGFLISGARLLIMGIYWDREK